MGKLYAKSRKIFGQFWKNFKKLGILWRDSRKTWFFKENFAQIGIVYKISGKVYENFENMKNNREKFEET